MSKRKKKFSFSISIQILIFLSLIAFFPIASMMMLKTYEKQQLALTESSNVQQARLTAAALATNIEESEDLLSDASKSLLLNMNREFDARIRILNSDGILLADSSTINEILQEPDSNSFESYESINSLLDETSPTETWIYRFFSLPIRFYRKFCRPPTPYYSSADYYTEKKVYDGIEIKQALLGKYGSATRISSGGQVSVTLYSAVPILQNEKVKGVVLVSRSTYKILQNLYELRLELGKIFAWSLIAVIGVTFLLSFHIILPLKKLSAQATFCADHKGKIITTKLPSNKRVDEIGELSRSFSIMLERLDNRIKFIEAFSADVAHEFKNPLAAIRSSAELANDDSLSIEERHQFITSINDEVAHLQSLLSGVRKLSLIDSEIDNTEIEEIPIDDFTTNIIERIKKRYPTVSFDLQVNCEKQTLSIAADWFDRILENLLDNAASFANKVFLSTQIDISQKSRTSVLIKVEDSGPGITEEEKDKLFNRFYSHRLDSDITMHTGLGLSIVKAIVEATNGKIEISKSEKLGGACFTISIPQSK